MRNKIACIALIFIGLIPNISFAQLADNEGFVILKFKLNETSIRGHYRDWDHLEVKNMETKKRYFLSPDKHHAFNETQVFTANLPAGNYYLTSFSALVPPQNFIVSIPDETMQFQIKARQLTYLGNMLEMTLSRSYKFFSGIKEKVLLPHDDPQAEEATSLINQLYPEHKSLLEKPVMGWTKTENTERKQKVFGLIKENLPVGWLNPYELSNGEVVFGTLIGSLRIFDVDEKKTRFIQTPLHDPITSFLELSDGTWLVGSEFGDLLFSTDQGNTWQKTKNKPPFGTISSMYLHNSDEIYLVSTTNKNTQLIKGNLNGEWNILVNEPAVSIPGNVYNFTGCQHAYMVQDNMILLAENKLLTYDLNSQTLSEQLLPGKGKKKLYGYFEVTSPNNIRIVKLSSRGIHKGLFQSNDLGKNWKEIDVAILSESPGWFYDDNQGVRLVFKRLSKFAAFERTEDGGKTWIEAKGSFDAGVKGFNGIYPDKLLKTKKNKTLLMYNDYGGLMLSKDGGENWEEYNELLNVGY